MAAGCATARPAATTPATTSPTTAAPSTVPPSLVPPSTVPPVLDTGDLIDPVVRRITVDDIDLTVAFVDRPETRARGLMEVSDLGDLDGMLFDLEVEREANFTMRNTLIPLDIVFFREDGQGVTKLTMQPCVAEPCPTYPSGGSVRYALEVPAHSVELTASSVLKLP